MLRKICYLLIVIFLIWLAFATRIHHQWFHPFVIKYGGDTIWAGMFLFMLRIFFSKINLWKLAIICYLLGAADEVSQLYNAPWIDTVRNTAIGGAMLGHGFLWSDLACYAAGTLLAFVILSLIE
ncbi:MAG TPA: DUF2809 domain-containing protein [Puia sp.]|nr:DUF2809 domain-containing protein [Puia sp.]